MQINNWRAAEVVIGKIPCLVILLATAMLFLQPAHAQERQSRGSWKGLETNSHPAIDPKTTYERLLPLAVAGDSDIQNLLGFMFFYAEGVELDYDQAHEWFHLAAEEGNLMAQRNLGLFHARARATIPDHYFDPIEANFWFSLYSASTPGESKLASQSYGAFVGTMSGKNSVPMEQRETGKNVYVTLCAGCHGFEAHASYPTAPSILMGDSLEKTDAALLSSILDGTNTMPAWRETISEEQAREALGYIRSYFEKNRNKLTKIPDHDPSRRAHGSPQDLNTGERVYVKFCGGCHGYNGISYYINSPSFALRERMHKSDSELAYSIRNGLGIMPSWENLLSGQEVDSLVRFIRTLAPAYESGIDHDLRVTPNLYFLFTPLGEADGQWQNRGGDEG